MKARRWTAFKSAGKASEPPEVRSPGFSRWCVRIPVIPLLATRYRIKAGLRTAFGNTLPSYPRCTLRLCRGSGMPIVVMIKRGDSTF